MKVEQTFYMPTLVEPAEEPLLPDEGTESDLATSFEAADAEVRAVAVGHAGHGQRLDRVLVGLAGEFSRSHLQRLIDAGEVQVDGHIVTQASRRVQAGQQIRVRLVPTEESLAFRPEAIALAIVHEDAHVLVLDKPAGLVVHPAAGHWSGTLLNGLLAHHPGASRLPRAGIVHRLDKDTSGLMVVGKTLEAVTALVRAIAAREVRREYLALAHGTLPLQPLSLDAPIGRDPQSRVRMAVVGGGRSARTDVQRVAVRDGISAVRCRLHSGRTHQIRVHMAHAGFALVADRLYGGAPALGLQRQALHAVSLAFQHPASGLVVDFDRPPPADFSTAWQHVVAGAATPLGAGRTI